MLSDDGGSQPAALDAAVAGCAPQDPERLLGRAPVLCHHRPDGLADRGREAIAAVRSSLITVCHRRSASVLLTAVRARL